MTGLAVHVDIGRYCLQQSNRLIEIKTQAVIVVLILSQNDFHLLIKNFETPFNPSNWSLQHLTIKIIIDIEVELRIGGYLLRLEALR